jgi:hypothetical protein
VRPAHDSEPPHVLFLKLILKVALSGVITAIYFLFVDAPPQGWLIVMNYGLFVGLVLQEIEGFVSTTTPRPTATATWVAAATPALILDGFWPVFGVGVFGAFFAELLTFQKERRKPVKLARSYWLFAGLTIVSGGVLTTLYGVHEVSALLALQIGASPPLFRKQIKRD